MIVYTLHRAVPLSPGKEERGTVRLNVFIRQIKWLQRLGVRFIGLNDMAAWLEGNVTMPSKRTAVLTIDDGYTCVYEHIFPFLREKQIPFTIFAVPGFIGGQSHLYAKKGLSPLQHMTTAQLREISGSGLVTFGANGFYHRNLLEVSARELREETRDAKNYLEDLLGQQVSYYAYPFGAADETVVAAVRESGYKLGFTTRKAVIDRARSDLLRLPRINWSRKTNLWKLYRYFFSMDLKINKKADKEGLPIRKY